MNPSEGEKKIKVEYPDEAGYPDGEGFLDEGTAGQDDRVDQDGVDDEVTDFEQELDEDDEHQATESS